MSLERPRSRWLAVAAAFWTVWCGFAGAALAEPPQVAPSDTTPELHPAPDLAALVGKPIVRIDVVTLGGRWADQVVLRRVRVGDALSGEAARRGMQELTDSGRYADVAADAEPEGNGVLLRLQVTPRRIVASTKVIGGVLDDDDTLHAASVEAGDEVTAATLAESAERLRLFYVQRGFPSATVALDAVDTDDDMQIILVLRIAPGAPRTISRRAFLVVPHPSQRLRGLLDDYGVGPGDRADDEALSRADHDRQDVLRRGGWDGATVSHRLEADGARAALSVTVHSGPEVQIRFEGNHRFDEAELTDALELGENDDRAPGTLAARIEKYYVERGFLDVRVTPQLRGTPSDSENVVVLHVRENDLVHVLSREYPCLTGGRNADRVGEEIDSFLSEALPGTGFVGAVDPAIVDSALGPRGTTGARVAPIEANPWRTYVADVYDRATRHLQELYRSEGYLSAAVGPVVLIRRACDRHSPAGKCVPVGKRVRPPVLCPRDATEMPVADPPPPSPCVPDPRHGVRCESDVVLQVPVKLGPRAVLWDVSFEGNEVLVEADLARIADLDLGAPVAQIELEKARRRLIDEYSERGFAFASIEQRIELSPDRTRARARFVINERDQVRVKDIVVRGAGRTNEGLILGRVALEKGGLYRRSLVRSTEERLATLGVFASVTVGLEDPEVFAKEKVVVISVRERTSQYLDVRTGFSTGDGFRVTFEYGHRNLGDRAIHVTLRAQLGLLPDFLIFDPVVRGHFQALPLQQRLERQDSISLELPEIGLGPLFPFGVDLIDVRDNSRDFGLTKDASVVTLSYRPTTRFVTQVGGSVERNDAKIFGGETIEDYVIQNPVFGLRLLVPDGTTLAVAERTNITWDRRDNPFNATSGTFAYGSVEHVHAIPIAGTDDTTSSIQPPPTSDFLRLQSRIAGYIPLTDKGLALALSFRWGENVQLIDGSKTYPDRLFFLGGVDSLRGFLQQSVIPEDLAERILADQKRAKAGVNPDLLLTPDKVVIRGGDLLLNPRAELRIPLGGVFQTALFLDAGNLWLDPRTVNPFQLRYAAGTGLRATTPVGPLALDVGVNLDRRYWEDPFAFHFSIGLF